MRKIAIIGASYLQVPLIQKAKQLGLETHVFAWESGDEGERLADRFYPISIVEKDDILRKCQEIGIDGICSIASDLASITVNYIAEKMGLICNSNECVSNTTNKYKMKDCLQSAGLPTAKGICISDVSELPEEMQYPLIVKPLDRSGSRGISKVESGDELISAVKRALSEGFEKKVLIEECICGQEYSVEYISWKGIHQFLALTQKYTTGAPHFIETGHLEPAIVKADELDRIKRITESTLNALGVSYGASHTEIRIHNGEINIIEIGARMGGDMIGSHLVYHSTGVDFVKGVIDVCLGRKPDITPSDKKYCCGIGYIFNDNDLQRLELIRKECPDKLIQYEIFDRPGSAEVTDSSNRKGYYILKDEQRDKIEKWLE